MKRVFLVRHAKAGDRSAWDGDDRERPLSKAGERQARALAHQLLRAGATDHLLSSPYVRCRQTLKPLAKKLHVKVRSDDRLAEAGSFGEVIALMEAAPDGAVLCSHGDVIPDVIAALERRGATFTTAPDWRKATVWEIAFDDGGMPLTAAVTPPPPD